MKFHQHGFLSDTIAILFIFVAWWKFDHVMGPLSLVSLFSFGLPDIDKKLVNILGKEDSKHRHWFWHSSILPIITFILGIVAGWGLVETGVFSLVIGFHLIGDLKPGSGGKHGYYLVYLRKGRRMTARQTDAYLGLNGLACVVASVIALVSG